jgi:hypothetical protein
MARISGLGCFFLVALRLVIGWHFAVEGVWKIRQDFDQHAVDERRIFP